jgi:hypothetical protein
LKTTGKNDKKPQKPKTSPTRKHRKAQKAKSWKKAKQRKNPFKLFLGTVILVLAVGYLAAGTYLYLNQRKFLYFPPAGVLPTAEQQIEIQSGDVTLRGWVVNPGNEDAIIYFGGTSKNCSAPKPFISSTTGATERAAAPQLKPASTQTLKPFLTLQWPATPTSVLSAEALAPVLQPTLLPTGMFTPLYLLSPSTVL